jgi:hypothetical protein
LRCFLRIYIHIKPFFAMDPFFYFEDEETEPQEVVQSTENVAISSGDIQDNASTTSPNTASYGI